MSTLKFRFAKLFLIYMTHSCIIELQLNINKTEVNRMNNDLSSVTSRRINELRVKHGYTIEKLAELVGVSKATISKWENGYVDNMRQNNVGRLANVFGVSPTYILGYDEEDSIRESEFTTKYEQLSENQKILIDNLIETFLSKK